ncbi:MAG: ComF family protein [Micrococcales bacterium]|nr:ComF family protein [Micrococcales bacterium]MCL2666409.1 ComF family protein [Micrococcales bacterium]
MLLGELGGLVVPVACAGCGVPDIRWCAGCARRFAVPVRCEHRAGRLDLLDGFDPPPVWCLADFAGPVRRAVTAWKDQGRVDMGRWFAGAMTAGARDREVCDVLAERAGPDGLLVVGVPTTRAAARRRGSDPVQELVRAVVRGVCADVPGRSVRPLRRRDGADSAGLGARARAQHLDQAVRVRRRWWDVSWAGRHPRVAAAGWFAGADRLAGARVVLVDDVLTTGATFAACRRALADAGASVVAGMVLASTPAPVRSFRVQPVRQWSDQANQG